MRPTRRQFLGAGATVALAGATGCGKLSEIADFMPALVPDAKGPFRAPASEAIDDAAHVLRRVGFGPRPEDYGRVLALAPNPRDAAWKYIEEQLAPESIEDARGDWAVRRFDHLHEEAADLYEHKERHLLKDMVRATFLRHVASDRQLLEVMVDFWTDHFNIDPSKGDCKYLKADDDREAIRKHALGKFPDLLRASALGAAMLWYLDGRVNVKADEKDRPNENYARELLELHTLGVHGGYTQRDVMEVARCLTGWTAHEKNWRKFWATAEVEFVASKHDDGEKIVLGERIPAGGGAEDFEAVLRIVVKHPSTARYIATKLCRKFVAEEPPEEAVAVVARAFHESGGDIRTTLRALFGTDAFWAERGNRFKRPLRFVVSALRATAARTRGSDALGEFLIRMGHVPFHYPTPDGFPDESAPWMGTLLWRWNFALALCSNRIAGCTAPIERLKNDFGGEVGLAAHLLGRTPTAEEIRAGRDSKVGPALAIASPAFQRY